MSCATLGTVKEEREREGGTTAEFNKRRSR